MSRWSLGLAGSLACLLVPHAFADGPAKKAESDAERAGRVEAERDAALKDAAAKAAAEKAQAQKAKADVLDVVLGPNAPGDAKAKDDKAPAGEPGKPAAPSAEKAPALELPPKEQEAFDSSMKEFAEDLKKQMTDLGARMAKDIKAQLTPEVEKRISDAMSELNKATAKVPAQKPAQPEAKPDVKPEAAKPGEAIAPAPPADDAKPKESAPDSKK